MRYNDRIDPSLSVAVEEFMDVLQVLVMSIEGRQGQGLNQCDHCDTVQRVGDRVLTAARRLRTCLRDVASER